MPTENWDDVITPRANFFRMNLRDIWKYRDLLKLFVRRDIVINYKQTVLGPLWFFIQPILTTMIFIIVFGNIAGLSTDGIPQPLFYMAGIVIWNYFSECFIKTSNLFSENSYVFGKVYFPRLITPLSIVISNGLRFLIQFGLFVGIYLYYIINGHDFNPSINLVYLPLLIFLMAAYGLGFGLIFSSLTSKYKDLKFLIQFGVQLMMYITPIIYPLNEIPLKYQKIMWYNPFAHIIETFKSLFFGINPIDSAGLFYSIGIAISLCFIGIFMFNRTERTFMDTV